MIYKAEIQHNEKTVQNLYRTQYYAYEKMRIFIRFLIGLAMIIAAVSVSMPVWGKCILLLIGAWIVVSPDFPAQVRSDKVIQIRKGNFPHIKYEFYDDKMKISDKKSENILYKDLTKLINDKKYFYLFITKNSVCMIDKETFFNQDTENFVKFIENKTGMKFHTQKSVFALNLQDLLNKYFSML